MSKFYNTFFNLCVVMTAVLGSLLGARPSRCEQPLIAVDLNDSELTESSGLAASLKKEGYLWTHNDSGDRARLFAFDLAGNMTGGCELNDVDTQDMEDMATFRRDDRNLIVVADAGDNLARRKSVTLYFFDEPNPTEVTTVRDFGTLEVTYPDGPRDCEAIAVDPQRNAILLVSKSAIGLANVYTIDLDIVSKTFPWKKQVVAKRILTLAIPMVTGIDIDQANGDVWIVNYFIAFQYPCTQRRMPFKKQLLDVIPNSLELPRLRQIEAVCVDRSGSVWVTSEGSPAPLRQIAVRPTPSSEAVRKD